MPLPRSRPVHRHPLEWHCPCSRASPFQLCHSSKKVGLADFLYAFGWFRFASMQFCAALLTFWIPPLGQVQRTNLRRNLISAAAGCPVLLPDRVRPLCTCTSHTPCLADPAGLLWVGLPGESSPSCLPMQAHTVRGHGLSCCLAFCSANWAPAHPSSTQT